MAAFTQGVLRECRDVPNPNFYEADHKDTVQNHTHAFCFAEIQTTLPRGLHEGTWGCPEEGCCRTPTGTQQGFFSLPLLAFLLSEGRCTEMCSLCPNYRLQHLTIQ